jgi:hypothetical protein
MLRDAARCCAMLRDATRGHLSGEAARRSGTDARLVAVQAAR